jgi:hypothetical protein
LRCIIPGSSRAQGVLCSGAFLGGLVARRNRLVACSTQKKAGGAKKSVVRPLNHLWESAFDKVYDKVSDLSKPPWEGAILEQVQFPQLSEAARLG